MSDEFDGEGEHDSPESEGDGLGEEPSETFDWAAEVFEASEAELDELEVLRFEMGGHFFAFPAESVAEVTAPVETTTLPGLPEHIAGVAIHRRNVVGVVDLARFLAVEPAGPPARFVMLEAGELDAAVIVEGVTGLEIWPEDTESATLLQNVDERVREFAIAARWAPGGVVVLLDAGRLLDFAAVR